MSFFFFFCIPFYFPQSAHAPALLLLGTWKKALADSRKNHQRDGEVILPGREKIDGQTSNFENLLTARHSRRSALYEFPDAQYAWRSLRKQLAFHAVAKIAASIGPTNLQTGRLHSAPMPQFPFPNLGPMFELATARILVAGRISRAASDLFFDMMAKNKITSIPIWGRPAWSRVEVGRLTHKERAWAERQLTGRIIELN